jgi:energy-coupling factor transport system ATP-binding protein
VKPAVVFDRVTFAYPDGPIVLNDVSMAVEEGSFALVTGPTGAGKSTLLRAINGLVPHFSGGSFSGAVAVEGMSTITRPPRALADVVGFVPQDPGASFVVERVEDELAYAMENLGVPPAAMRRRVEETLDLLDLDVVRDRSVRTLSGGERQRVAIAAALTARPRVLVVDEPTSQLDPQGAEDVLAALKRLVDDVGITVVLSEHRLERVAGFADVGIGCAGGGEVTVGPVAEILQSGASGPPVARLGRLLGWEPLPLTVRAARRSATETGVVPRRPSPPTPPVGASNGTLLEARGLSASYGDLGALKDVDLTVRAGEVVVVMGRNGAGKTTLLRCLAGLHRPVGGTVAGPAGSPRPGIDAALCPQAADTVLFRDRVRDEVAPLRKDGIDPRRLMDDFGVAGLSDRHPRDLSAGERVLVATAAMAATGAPVLLLDEPTRGLDPDAKARLVGFARRHAGRGGTVVCATHDVELAAELATRAVMLAGGEVIADGAPSDVFGDSPVFAPQTARVFGPLWLTPEQVAAAVCTERAPT